MDVCFDIPSSTVDFDRQRAILCASMRPSPASRPRIQSSLLEREEFPNSQSQPSFGLLESLMARQVSTSLRLKKLNR